MIDPKEKDLKDSRFFIFAIFFLINFFIYIIFKDNFNVFIYTYIISFDIFALINLIFIKKLNKFIELYTAISMSLFSFVLFLSGLFNLKNVLYILNFIEITILLIIIYLSIIILSINHIKKFYSSRKIFMKNSPKYALIVSGSIFGLFLGKFHLSKYFVNTLAMLVLGCSFAICYSYFYKFYLVNKSKKKK